ISRIAALVFLVIAVIAANATVDNWTVVRYFGGLRLPRTAGEFIEPIFHRPLHFYFFGLPFYNMILHVVITGAVLVLLIYWLASNADTLTAMRTPTGNPGTYSLEFQTPLLGGRTFNSTFVRFAAALLLVGLAIKFFFNRYNLLFEDHGLFLVGVDWVADHIVLPLQWLMIFGALAAAALIFFKRPRWALLLLVIPLVRYVLPSLVAGLYVRPNELALERPYIQHHIDATRQAYGLNQRVKETSLAAEPEIRIDYSGHEALLSNVRLWDWQAFQRTLSQIQPLRPYIYYDTDVDRYTIDGQLRQVLLSARDFDIRQLGIAANWINSHLIYTHGYGIVMAEANRITSDGLPYLFVQNAPPELTTKSLKFTRPELYFAEISQEPVFVDTAQQEFNYPSGSKTEYTAYTGRGGFPVSSLLMRLAAAIGYSDANILLTDYLKGSSRMMIHRAIRDRLSTLAGFLTWDSDPYIVLTSTGRLIWMADGYMTSDAHPYSRALYLNDRSVNYMRNSVKATVDAYTGEVNLYVFDPNDVLIEAYRRLFPTLFKPLSAMPDDIRAHARYPETLFSAQAEIYRTFHMRDPEAFYNRADLWDLAHTSTRQTDAGAQNVSPSYVVASLPGENQAEFMLITVFTPANKDNLIAFMAARCDGAHLGELVFEQLSKQNIIFGPMQIDARINQDQNISKDLTLWSQQGSSVIRGQTLVLPIDNSFLYVEPIYIQASQASMPQLKKVALAMGNRLVYQDTYEQALSQLIAELGGTAPPQPQPNQPAPAQTAGAPQAAPSVQQPSNQAVQTLQQIRDHLRRYRELSSQGKWAEAGKELDAIQSLVQR
ncbi:MAG: UPF0182 family protein, partial [Acidobacteriaceae bacterium]|nr:UPF0182 family protein [Acidobacteriaceae bacterium]